MKYLRHILLILIASLACSCIDDGLKDMIDTTREGEKIDVDFSVHLPGDGTAYTKALGENPTINNLYLAVFDEAGYLVEYVKATEKAVDQNGSANQKAYTVKLTLSNAKRIIHFIANNTETPKYGTEVESIGALTTSNQWDVYWQRTVLENGIQLQADGETITEETKNALNNIGLIRNFAKLTMSSEAANFVPLSFYVVNERTKGSVAPYNTSTGSFVDNYKGYGSLLDLQNIGYDGYIPRDATLNSTVPATTTEFDKVATPFKPDADRYENYHYLYERETPLDFKTQPYIIVKGMYGNEGPYYYKISFSSYEGKLFPFLRNFNYGITIKTVNRKGSDTPLLASTSTGSGDISTSIDPTIINISDGTQRLFISYTDTLLVTDNTIKLRYKYIPDLGSGTTANDILANPETAQNSGVFFSVVTDQNTTVSANNLVGPVIKSYKVATSDESDGYRTVTLQINNTQDIDLKEFILVSGQRMTSGNRDILSRKVTYTLRKKQPLRVVCDPSEVEQIKGSTVNVKLGIPAGLGESQFPMNITVEALNLTLTPDNDNLPVQTGKSTAISGETVGKPAFWFIRTVTWDEYSNTQTVDEYKYVDCHFKTNTAASASSIVASNKYFDQGTGAFTNYTANNFTNLDITGSFNAFTEKPVTLKFNLPALPYNSNGNVDDSYVYIVLDGAESADSRLTQVGTVTINGKKLAQYRYKPTNTGTQSLDLLTTDDNTGVVKAYLSAYHYNDANVSKKAKIWFYFGDEIHTQGDPWYSGARNGGIRLNSSTTFTWYVHYEDLKETLTSINWNNFNTIQNKYTSSVTINGQKLSGTLQSTSRNNQYSVTTFTDSDGTIYLKYKTNNVFNGQTIGNVTASFDASDKTNVGADTRILKVRSAYVFIEYPVEWFTSSHSGFAVKNETSRLYVDVYLEDGTNGQISMYINGQRMGDAIVSNETHTYNGRTYKRYYYDYSPWETGYQPIKTVVFENGVEILSKDNTLPVGRVDISLGTALTSASFDTSKKYVLKNRTYQSYLSYQDNALKGTDNYTTASLFSFGGNSSPTTIKNIASGKYIRESGGAGNRSFTLDSNSTNLTIGSNNDGFTFSISHTGVNYYVLLSAKNSSMGINNWTDRYITGQYWDIIPVNEAYYDADGNKIN